MKLKNLLTTSLKWKIIYLVAFIVLVINLYYLFTSATNDGPWKTEYQHLAKVEVNEDKIAIKNFRRVKYDDLGKPKEIDWSSKEVNLNDLKSIWYGISVFSSPGFAHTFLSFDFGDSDPVVISVEARMRPKQSYHPIEGLLDSYHLIYVFADERDIIGVRTHKRHEAVYFMPIEVSKERGKKMFIDMVTRANQLIGEPEFYNTFTSNCTNSIMKDTQVPSWQTYLDPRIILPGYSDRIAYQYGVLDSNYTREQIRTAALINPDDLKEEDIDYSNNIRKAYYQRLQQTALSSEAGE